MANYSIYRTFIKFSSQTICGIKPANLFTVSEGKLSQPVFNSWKQNLSDRNLEISALKRVPGSWIIFVYDPAWIEKILENSCVSDYLKSKGYENPCDAERTVEELFRRIQYNDVFPHEVGIFLGYPVEDVICFENHRGHNCKYCGYWESYSNPEEARKCCEEYRKCSLMCEKWFTEGYSIPKIIEKYREAVRIAA